MQVVLMKGRLYVKNKEKIHSTAYLKRLLRRKFKKLTRVCLNSTNLLAETRVLRFSFQHYQTFDVGGVRKEVERQQNIAGIVVILEFL